MKIRFLSRASKGSLALRKGLKEIGHNVLKIKKVGSTYRGFSNHLVVGWGSTSRGLVSPSIPILNTPEAVENASDKVKTFQILQAEGMEHNLPRWCTLTMEAREMIEEGEVVYCRTLPRGSQGRGIVIASNLDEMVTAPLYTAKVDVSREVRVHVFKDNPFHFAQKKRMGGERREAEGILEANDDIRSHENGWIFSITDVEIPQEAKDVAVKAVKALGLDFGAVDMALTPQGVCKIYEVNTAPGLEGTTLSKYIEVFNDYANGYMEE